MALRGTDDIQARNEPTWPATQVCPRPVKAGLGGHDDGVWGVDDRVKNASLRLQKRGRTAGSECSAFSGFARAENDGDIDKRTTAGKQHDNKSYHIVINNHPLSLRCVVKQT